MKARTAVLRLLLICSLVFLICMNPVFGEEEKGLKTLPVTVRNYDRGTAKLLLLDYLKLNSITICPNAITLSKDKENILTIKEIPSVVKFIDDSYPKLDPKCIKHFDVANVKNWKPADFPGQLKEVLKNFGYIIVSKYGDIVDDTIVCIADDETIIICLTNFEAASADWNEGKRPGSGYNGIQLTLRGSNEKMGDKIKWLKTVITELDSLRAYNKKDEADVGYHEINLHYIEVKEAIDALRAAGFSAFYYGPETEASEEDKEKNKTQQIPDNLLVFNVPQSSKTHNTLSSVPDSDKDAKATKNVFDPTEFKTIVSTSDIHRLIVYGTDKQRGEVQDFITVIDRPARQIFIEAVVVELNINDLDDIGLKAAGITDDRTDVSFNTKDESFNLSDGDNDKTLLGTLLTYDDGPDGNGSFMADLYGLVERDKATILARPKVTTVDGRQAIIHIGRHIAVDSISTSAGGTEKGTEYITVGITLNIKPRIGAGGEIQMQVDAVVSDTEGIGGNPDEINVREVSNIVRVPDGRAMILGGLISTERETRKSKVPLLGDLFEDIDILEDIFTRTRTVDDRKEVIIIITPHVADELGNPFPGPDDNATDHLIIDDPYLYPPGSPTLDSLGNQYFHDKHLLSLYEIQGIHPISGEPYIYQYQINSLDDPVVLTLLELIRILKLEDRYKGSRIVDYCKISYQELADEFQDFVFLSELSPDDEEFIARARILLYLRSVNNLLGRSHLKLKEGLSILIPIDPDPKKRFMGFMDPGGRLRFKENLKTVVDVASSKKDNDYYTLSEFRELILDAYSVIDVNLIIRDYPDFCEKLVLRREDARGDFRKYYTLVNEFLENNKCGEFSLDELIEATEDEDWGNLLRDWISFDEDTEDYFGLAWDEWREYYYPIDWEYYMSEPWYVELEVFLLAMELKEMEEREKDQKEQTTGGDSND